MSAHDARDQTPPIEGGKHNAEEPGHVPAIEDFRSVMVQRAIFQSVASMGLPAFTIHSIVRYSGRALKDAKNRTIRTYGPIGVRRSPLLLIRTCTHAVKSSIRDSFRLTPSRLGGK